VNIAEHFTWHRKRIPSAPPRIHTRGVYVDERGHGSGLGSPAFAPEFRRYLENPFAALRALVQAEFNVGRVQAVLVPVWSCVSGDIHVISTCTVLSTPCGGCIPRLRSR
jgi:hypothetical protein